eukprot:3554535-Pleurochrysis_carterae.AAC.2
MGDVVRCARCLIAERAFASAYLESVVEIRCGRVCWAQFAVLERVPRVRSKLLLWCYQDSEVTRREP